MTSDNKQKKKLKKMDLGVTLLLIVGILVVVNFFSYQIFYRWDLTQDKIFSISPASKGVLSGLDDIVNIKAYFSATLPSQVLALKQEVADLLAEYEAYSGGKVRVEFIDPGDDQDIQRELAIEGIPQLTFQVYEKDKMQLVNGYMGIAISHSGNTEVIPAVKQTTNDLEYQITTAIKKVTADQIATIGYLSSHGTADYTNELKAAGQGLEEIYTVEQVDLSGDTPSVPDEINTLVIVGPTEKFEEPALKAINAFVKRGGALFVMLDGVNIGQGLAATKNNTGLDTLLKKYGITLNQDLVADTRSGVASFSQGYITFSSSYAFWPKITTDGFNPDNSAVSGLENVIFPWVSSIDVDAGKFSEGDFSYLAHTTANGWRVTDNFDVTPNAASVPQGERKSYNLVATINGQVADAYPDGSEGDTASFPARIVVVGDSDYVRDGFVQNSPDNLTMFQNLVDSLSLGEDLMSIRSKGASSRPIKEDLSETGKAGIRYANIFGLTLAVLAFGLIRYFMRRRSRFIDDL